jgi:hypothetical protein
MPFRTSGNQIQAAALQAASVVEPASGHPPFDSGFGGDTFGGVAGGCDMGLAGAGFGPAGQLSARGPLFVPTFTAVPQVSVLTLTDSGSDSERQQLPPGHW